MIGNDDNSVLLVVKFGASLLSWMKEVKYQDLWYQSRKGLLVNIDLNCRKFIGVSCQWYFAEMWAVTRFHVI